MTPLKKILIGFCMLLLILPACSPNEPPSISAWTAAKESIPVFEGNSGRQTFEKQMETAVPSELPYVPLNNRVTLAFSTPPDQVTVSDYALNAKGEVPSLLEKEPDSVLLKDAEVMLTGKTAEFTVTEHQDYDMEPGGFKEKEFLRGYLLHCRYGMRTYEYHFLLRSDYSYGDVAPEVSVSANGRPYSIHWIVPAADAEERLNTVSPDLMLIEEWEEQAPPLQYGDTVQFQFPSGMPEQVECANDIFLLDDAQKSQGASCFLYEKTSALPSEMFKITDGGVTVTLAEPVFTCSEQAVNGLRISCSWPDGSDFCYSLWFRLPSN